MRILTVLALIAAPGFAHAQDCAPGDYTDEMHALFEQARAAPSEAAARGVSAGLWQIYLRAPDDQAQAMLDRGMARAQGYDFLGAKSDFDLLIAYCPDYAEGWNQRAFASYLQGDYAAALADLDEALLRNPDHVAAQSGRALTLMQMDRRAEARAQMLEALANNPWLSERALVANGAPLGPELGAPGEDI